MVKEKQKMRVKHVGCLIGMIGLCVLSGCGNTVADSGSSLEQANMNNGTTLEQADTDNGTTLEQVNTNNGTALEQMAVDYDAERIMSEEELAEIEWKETISPYMEYDWLNDEHVEQYYDTQWLMQLADLNQDGQEEMLVTLPIYNKDSLTYVYTVEDGTVVYCGQILAGSAYEYNDLFMEQASYLPLNYIDVYENEDGEFRYLSGNTFLHGNGGYYQIYENKFDGKQITSEPLYAINFYEDTDGKMIYEYAEGDWLKRESEVTDDPNFMAFTQEMEAYMKGWERVDITFLASEFRVPGFVNVLPEEKKEIIRDNIVAGFARIEELF